MTCSTRRAPRLVRAWALVLAAALVACGHAPERRLQARGTAFGTGWSVIVSWAEGEQAPLTEEELVECVTHDLEVIDRSMSTWREDSVISRFNAAQPGERVEVDGAFVRVCFEALRVGEATSGAFDPTVLPLVELWGFGAAQSVPPAPPGQDEIAECRARVGLDRLRELIGTEPFSAVQLDPPLELDFSAIAKGFAVDSVALSLSSRGAEHYFVEVGGEVRVHGMSPRGEAWRVGVTRPTRNPGDVAELAFAVAVSDGAVATSGDYRNFRIVDGRKLSHTIDPATGYPVESPPASVTVVAPFCYKADAWATALCVLGPDEGLALIEQEPELEALFLMRPEAGDDFTRRASSGFERLIVERP